MAWNAVSIGDESFKFTMGYVSWWNEYPGPYIPAPVQIASCGPTDLRQRALEILALTKMNWNSSEGIGRYETRREPDKPGSAPTDSQE